MLRTLEDFQAAEKVAAELERMIDEAPAESVPGDFILGDILGDALGLIDRQIFLSPAPVIEATAVKLRRVARWRLEGAPLCDEEVTCLHQVIRYREGATP